MTLPRADRAYQVALLLTGGAFAVMTMLLVHQNLRLQGLVGEERARRERSEVRALMEAWEGRQAERIREEVARWSAPELPARPAAPFEQAWLWVPGPQDGEPGRILSPTPEPPEDVAAALADPCLAAAAAADGPATSLSESALAWSACLEGEPAASALAASRAMERWMQQGEPARALAVHDQRRAQGPVPSLDRAVVLGLQRAAALQALGEEEAAARALRDEAERILAAPPDALERLESYLAWPILADLEAMGRKDLTPPIAQALPEARRRVLAWREVRRMIESREESLGAPLALPPSDPEAPGASPRVGVITDALGARRFLLIRARRESGEQLALLADPLRLLDELNTLAAGRRVVVLDPLGRPLLPTSAGLEPVGLRPLSILMPELRVGLEAERGPGADASPGLWLLPWLLPALGFGLGGLSLLAWRRADRQRRELWERQQAFINRVSHELKTPLAGMKSMAGVLEMGAITEPAEVRQCAQRTMTEISRLEDRVNEILRYARRPQLHRPEELDLQAMVEDLTEAWEPRFEQAGIILTTDLRPTDPVRGERELIRDAINNLLDNAWKYMREDRPGLVHVRSFNDDGWVCVEVADNGLGVPPPMRRAIFERFTRVEGEGRGKAGGHGLGLAFVDEAIASHGGRVDCRDGIQGGALFLIRLRRIR